MDELTEYLRQVTVADVDRDRLAVLARAERERFIGAGHRRLLAVHNRQIVAWEAAKARRARREAAERRRQAAIRAAVARVRRMRRIA